MTQVFPELHSPLALPLIFINLDADGARRLKFEAAFEAIGVSPRRLAATRWTRLSKAEQDLFYSDDLNTCSYFRPLVDVKKAAT